MRKLDKYDTLQPLLIQIGWVVLPPIVIAIGIKGTVLKATMKHLQYLHILTSKNPKTNGNIHTNSNSMSYSHCLKKQKLMKNQAPTLLD
jgi:hypothetical protein